MQPIECVVRGYLTGSGWLEYRESGTVCGIRLPAGLENGDRLPAPIYTPAFKAPMGEHDENISFERTVELVGEARADELRDLSLEVYERAARTAESRGLILADTKFEFGLDDDGVMTLADEVLTSDSSRYWDAAAWESGTTPAERMASFDKQIVRDWLAAHLGQDRARRPGCPTRSSSAPPPATASCSSASRPDRMECARCRRALSMHMNELTHGPGRQLAADTAMGAVTLLVGDLDGMTRYYRDVVTLEVLVGRRRDRDLGRAGRPIVILATSPRSGMRLPDRRACSTPRSCSRPRRRWPPRCTRSRATRRARSPDRPTTSSARPSTSPTPRATASSCTGTARAPTGPGCTARSRWRPCTSTRTPSSASTSPRRRPRGCDGAGCGIRRSCAPVGGGCRNRARLLRRRPRVRRDRGDWAIRPCS